MIGTGFFDSNAYNNVRKYNIPLLINAIHQHFPQNIPVTAAEFGSGSGLFTQILIQSNLTIEKLFLVDPDKQANEQHYTLFRTEPHFDRFTYVQSPSDASSLKSQSIDGLFCMQAFHWFDRKTTRQEFLRILKQDAKLFIAGKFLIPVNEASAAYLEMTRFGKRKNGMRDNREAYTLDEMAIFFGHPVEKQIVCQETEYKTLDQLKALMQLRIDSSDDDMIKNKASYIQEQTEQFFYQYADTDNTVVYVSETFYFCDSMS